MEFRPRRLLGILVGSSIVLSLLGAVAYFLYQLKESPISLAAFGLALGILVLLAFACLFAFWTYGCWSLRYQIDRNYLTICWATERQIIPLSLINGLALGKNAGRFRAGGIHWPGYHVGKGRVTGIGKAVFYTAHRSREDLVYVLTPKLAYAISVANPSQFAAELELRRRLGSTHAVGQEASRESAHTFPILKDGSAVRLLALGLLLNVALFGYISYAYPAYPPLLPFLFNLLGRIAEESSKITLLLPPSLGLGVLLGNTLLSSLLHSRERFASYVFLICGIVIQILLWIATIRAATPGF